MIEDWLDDKPVTRPHWSSQNGVLSFNTCPGMVKVNGKVVANTALYVGETLEVCARRGIELICLPSYYDDLPKLRDGPPDLGAMLQYICSLSRREFQYTELALWRTLHKVFDLPCHLQDNESYNRWYKARKKLTA